MDYDYLMFLHLKIVLPCFIIGTFVLFMKKGTKIHKFLGRIYMVLMLFTAIVTLFMPAQVGPQVLNHFGALLIAGGFTLFPGRYLNNLLFH